MMTPTLQWELLRAWVDQGSEEAFASLVHEFVDVVYASALRQVHDRHLAQDVTQIVFVILARKAGTIRHDAVLSAWLHRTTRFTAKNVLRTEARRVAKERKAAEMARDYLRVDSSWQRLSPMLDQGIARLNEKDRAAILLRYFEQRSVAETAEALGTSEAAAAMRIHRAVDKLRAWFRARRVDLPTAGLAGILWANGVHSAPHGLAADITGQALSAFSGAAGAQAAVVAAESVMRDILLAKVRSTACMAGGALAAMLAIGLILDHTLADLFRAPPHPDQTTSAVQTIGLRQYRIAMLDSLMNT